MPWARGQAVLHPHFGPGSVRALLDGGRRIRVSFERFGGLIYTLPVEQFTTADEAPRAAPRSTATALVPGLAPPSATAPSAEATLPPRPPAAAPVSPAEWIAGDEAPEPVVPVRARRETHLAPSARQVLEALRLGVVPPARLDAYTVGREHELARIARLLGEGHGLVVVEGHYGSGKTHLLELVEAQALERGFLVSRVTADPLEVPLSHPGRVYQEVIRGLVYPHGEGGSLRPLLEHLAASPEHRSPRGSAFHRYLSPALFALASGDAALAADLVDFVDGLPAPATTEINPRLAAQRWVGPTVLALPDYRTFGQVYAYLLGGVAAWARDAGHAGLALLFDEAESLDLLESQSRTLAETVLRYLAIATLPRAALAFDPAKLYRGGQRVHREVPDRYREDQPLVAVFAFTPLDRVARAIRESIAAPECFLALEPLPRERLPELARRVTALHQTVHPSPALRESEIDRLERHLRRGLERGELDTTRQVARLVVEYLDIHRRDPALARAALAG